MSVCVSKGSSLTNINCIARSKIKVFNALKRKKKRKKNLQLDFLNEGKLNMTEDDTEEIISYFCYLRFDF